MCLPFAAQFIGIEFTAGVYITQQALEGSGYVGSPALWPVCWAMGAACMLASILGLYGSMSGRWRFMLLFIVCLGGQVRLLCDSLLQPVCSFEGVSVCLSGGSAC